MDALVGRNLAEMRVRVCVCVSLYLGESAFKNCTGPLRSMRPLTKLQNSIWPTKIHTHNNKYNPVPLLSPPVLAWQEDWSSIQSDEKAQFKKSKMILDLVRIIQIMRLNYIYLNVFI